jgi:transposase
MESVGTRAGAEHSNERANDLRSSARTEQIEVRVRHERHRRWRPDEKFQIVQETLVPGAVISDVARRYGIGTGLLYTWRKAMRAPAPHKGFVPVSVSPEPEAPALPPGQAVATLGAMPTRLRPTTGRIEVEFPNGVRVRIDGGVDGAALRNVLAVLERG